MRVAGPVSSFVAHQWHCDHFGHLNARHYAAAFDDAVLIFWNGQGLVVPTQGEDGTIPVTGRLTIEYLSEALAGTVLDIFVKIGRVGGKSVTICFEMRDSRASRLVATCETIEVFFDARERVSAAIPAHIRASLEDMVAEQPALLDAPS
jgi:acyl-CoA thioesterase FadM